MTNTITVYAQHINGLDRTLLGAEVSLKIPERDAAGNIMYGLTKDQIKHLVGQATGLVNDEGFLCSVLLDVQHICRRCYVVSFDEQVVVTYQYESDKQALIELFCDTQF